MCTKKTRRLMGTVFEAAIMWKQPQMFINNNKKMGESRQKYTIVSYAALKANKPVARNVMPILYKYDFYQELPDPE